MSRATTSNAKLMATIKTLGLTVSNSKLKRRPPSADVTAMSTEHNVTVEGLDERRCAAAAGVMARLSTNKVPTSWAASVTVTARTNKKSSPSSPVRTPRAWATSGSTDEKSRGRHSTAMMPVTAERDDGEENDLGGTDPENVAEQDIEGLAGVAVVVAEHEDAEAETRSEDHPDARVPLGGLAPEGGDETGHDQRADQRADQRVVGNQETTDGAGERQLTGAVDGKRHRTRDDEGPDQTTAQRHQERGLEGVLGEPEMEVVPNAHQWWCPGPWCACPPGSVATSSSALTTKKRSRTLMTSTGMP